jgi:hypothetical protein
MRTRVMKCLAPLLGLLSIVGCPSAKRELGEGRCSKVGQTCKLADGLLGVCNDGDPERCDAAPCLVCIGQH